MFFKSDLHAGRAGELIAATEFLYRGYDCSLSDQGMPYDLVCDIEGKLFKVQVKTTRKPELIPGRGKGLELYRFWVSRCGKGGKQKYSTVDVDLFAVVALDTKQVGFIASNKMPKSLFVRPDARRGLCFDEIVAIRNSEVLALIKSGMSAQDVSKSLCVHSDYVSKIKNGRVNTKAPGVYFSDLTLESALAAMNDNNGRTIGGRKPRTRSESSTTGEERTTPTADDGTIPETDLF